jgi:hypothetical protein
VRKQVTKIMMAQSFKAQTKIEVLKTGVWT